MPNSKVIIQGICYDVKSSYRRGPALAPPLIRQKLWSDAYNSYAENGVEISASKIVDKGDFEIREYFEIEKITKAHLSTGLPLITLGGDHSITYPVIKAFAEYHGDFEILHIDAHADLYEEFEGDKHSHACPFARIMEDDLVTGLTQVGIRTLTPHLRDQIKKYNVQVIEMKDFNLNHIREFHKPLYISLDIDAFDPAYAPGVSHQESGGLNVRQVLQLIDKITVPIIGADIVEYNPSNDVGEITAVLCAKMTKEILARMLN